MDLKTGSPLARRYGAHIAATEPPVTFAQFVEVTQQLKDQA